MPMQKKKKITMPIAKKKKKNARPFRHVDRIHARSEILHAPGMLSNIFFEPWCENIF